MSEIVFTPASDRPPVFVLVLDSARFDRLQPFSDVVPIGKHLTELAGDGVAFANMRSSSSWTRTAIAGLFTGLRPARHRVYGRLDVLEDSLTTLGEVLQEGGYFTRAWSTNPDVFPAWGFAQGFDVFTDVGAMNSARAKTDASDLLDRVEANLPRPGDVPEAHYLHFMDAHAPYQPPQEILDEIDAMADLSETFPGPDEIDSLVSEFADYQRYLGELVDVDRAIGRFVAELKHRGLYEEALILVVADHGEEFLDHGGMSHGRTLFEESLRIPAILKLPGSRSAGTTISASASIEDLFSTVLAALDLEAPAGVDGIDLLAKGEASGQRPHFSVLRLDGRRLDSVVDGSRKLIVDPLNRRTSLFDLSSDPFERNDLYEERPEDVAVLTSLLAAARSSAESGWHFLFCGTEYPIRFELLADGEMQRPRLFDLEPDDRVEFTDEEESGIEMSMSLTPYKAARVAIGEAKEVSVEDRDLVRVTQAASADPAGLVVRTPRGVPFRYALGTERTISASRTLDLHEHRERAVVSDASLVECPPTGDERRSRQGWGMAASTAPFVRIWYVPPAD